MLLILTVKQKKKNHATSHNFLLKSFDVKQFDENGTDVSFILAISPSNRRITSFFTVYRRGRVEINFLSISPATLSVFLIFA